MTICYWFAVWEAYQRAPLAWSRCGALSGALRGVQASGVLIAQHRLNKQPGCDLIIRGASRRPGHRGRIRRSCTPLSGGSLTCRVRCLRS